MSEDSYTVFVVVEVEETGEQKWFVVDHHHTAPEAMEQAETILQAELDRTGVPWQELDS